MAFSRNAGKHVLRIAPSFFDQPTDEWILKTGGATCTTFIVEHPCSSGDLAYQTSWRLTDDDFARLRQGIQDWLDATLASKSFWQRARTRLLAVRPLARPEPGSSNEPPAGQGFYPYATKLPLVVDKPCTYTPLPAGDGLIATDDPAFLNEPIPLHYKTPRFQVFAQKDLELIGFRTFLTADGRSFTDESLDPDWKWDSYAEHFRAGKPYEAYRAQVGLRGMSPILEREPIVIEEPVTTLCANEPSNYGSWIYRILPKLIGLPDDDRALLVHAPQAWQQQLLRFFAPRRRIIQHQPRQRYLLRDAHVASVRNVHVFFDDQTRDFYRRRAERVKERSDLKRIYLSRRDQMLPPLLNEQAVEEALAGEGFTIVQPEALPLRDRIRVIRDAEVIVCPGGSGLFNLVFALYARLVVDLEPSRTWLYAHHNLVRSLHQRHATLFGEQVDGEDPHRPWTASVDKLVRATRL